MNSRAIAFKNNIYVPNATAYANSFLLNKKTLAMPLQIKPSETTIIPPVRRLKPLQKLSVDMMMGI